MSELTPEMREALDRRGDNRMSAYFFGFDSTTSDAVNDVLAAVAFAGKAFHSTEQWGDDDYMPFTMVDLIQATANEAADHIAKVEAERDALREMVRRANLHIDPAVDERGPLLSGYGVGLAFVTPEQGK